MEQIKRFFKEEEGLEMSEYALMGGLICLAVVGAVILMRDQIVAVIDRITGVLTTAAA